MNGVNLSANIIDESDIKELISWLNTNPRLTKGNRTIEFEDKFSTYLGNKYSLFCNSGSSANLLAIDGLKNSGYLKNNKIIVPEISWATTVAPTMQLGLEPILCDCDSNNLGVDIDEFYKIVKHQKPSAAIIVHVLGLDSNIEKIVEMCEENSVHLIEDTCESLGSEVSNKKLGSFGIASTFSFYFGHHISTIEGGMVSTNDEYLNEVMSMLRSHGWDRDLKDSSKMKYRNIHNIDNFSALYRFYYPGYNLRSTDLQAVIGINQLKKIPDIVKKREYNYKLYRENLEKFYWTPKETENQNVVSNMGYPMILPDRAKVSKSLMENGIEHRPLVSGRMSNQPMWIKKYGEKSKTGFSNKVDDNGIYLPNNHEIKDEEILHICSIVNNEARDI